MKISRVDVFRHPLPVVDAPYKMASGDIWAVETSIVKITCDNGVIGWGETCPVGQTYSEAHVDGAQAALKLLAKGLIGKRAQPLHVKDALNGLLTGHNYAKAAIDIATHDALARSLNLRVCDLLGGARQIVVPSYYATGIGEPDEVARRAEEKAAEGYGRLQVKVGGRRLELDIETARKVWEKVGHLGIKLAIDANRGWTTGDAITFSQQCRDIPCVLEQPCNTVDEIRTIRPLVRHPIYMDESSVDLNTVASVAGTGLVDGFGMKVTRIGGLQQMAAFRDICEARAMRHSCDDSWGGDIIAAACVHIASTVTPQLLEGVWLAAPYIEGNYDAENGVRVEGGSIKLPDGPGLGVVPDETAFGTPVASYF